MLPCRRPFVSAGAAHRKGCGLGPPKPAPGRALLVGMGLTELLLVSLTDRAPGRRVARRA